MDRHEWLDAATHGIRDPAKARDVREELETHIEAVVAALRSAGLPEADAEREALRRMGDRRTLGRSLVAVTGPERSPGRRAALAMDACLVGLGGMAVLGLAAVPFAMVRSIAVCIIAVIFGTAAVALPAGMAQAEPSDPGDLGGFGPHRRALAASVLLPGASTVPPGRGRISRTGASWLLRSRSRSGDPPTWRMPWPCWPSPYGLWPCSGYSAASSFSRFTPSLLGLGRWSFRTSPGTPSSPR